MTRSIVVVLVVLMPAAAAAQFEAARAEAYLQEAAALCAREAGRLWGRSLVAAGSREGAVTDALDQLSAAPKAATFVRTFAYPSGPAYGLLLDAASPEWRRTIRGTDDLGALLAAASRTVPTASVEAAESRYGAAALRASEAAAARAREERLQAQRRLFVEGPILILPGSRNNSFRTDGMTVIPGHGTVYPSFRTTAEWGTLEASAALLTTNRDGIRVPGPFTRTGARLTGEGWTLDLAPGWTVGPASRTGDHLLVREPR